MFNRACNSYLSLMTDARPPQETSVMRLLWPEQGEKNDDNLRELSFGIPTIGVKSCLMFTRKNGKETKVRLQFESE